MSLEPVRRWFRSLFLPSDRLFYLAVFRVILAAIILLKIIFLWPNTQFLFAADGLYEYPDKLSKVFIFIPQSIIWDNLFLFYGLYASLAVCMLLGVGRCWTVALVWFFTEIHQCLNWVLLDGGDNLVKFDLLYLIFADSFSYLSLKKTNHRKQGYSLFHFSTNIAVVAIISHLCLVYFVSGVSKAHAEVWYNGTAMYYILLGERFRGTDWLNDILAHNSFFNVTVCYTTILLETCFPFAVFVRKIRIPVLLMGVAMHSSIYFLMMIQTFQIVYIIHYGLFFTDDEWARFLGHLKSLTLEPAGRFLAQIRTSMGLATGLGTNTQDTPIVDSRLLEES